MADITIEQCQQFLNITTKYDDISKTYNNLTQLQPSLIFFNDVLKTHLKELEEKLKTTNQKPLFTNKEEMITAAKKFFTDQGGELAKVAKVFDNPEITFKIKLQEVGYCTSYTTLDANNKSHHDLAITPDTKGLLALCQEMLNAHVLAEARENNREIDKENEYLMHKTTNIALSSLLIDFMLKNTPNLSDQEIDLIKYNSFKELQFETNYLMADQVLYKKILESCPEIFESTKNNYSAENFLSAMNKMKHSTLDPSLQETIKDRITDIAMKGNTARYLQGDVALQLAHMKNPTNDYITNRLKESALNTAVRQLAGGEQERDIINEGANTINDPTKDLEALLVEYGHDADMFRTCLKGNGHKHDHEDENVMIKQKKHTN